MFPQGGLRCLLLPQLVQEAGTAGLVSCLSAAQKGFPMVARIYLMCIAALQRYHHPTPANEAHIRRPFVDGVKPVGC